MHADLNQHVTRDYATKVAIDLGFPISANTIATYENANKGPRFTVVKSMTKDMRFYLMADVIVWCTRNFPTDLNEWSDRKHLSEILQQAGYSYTYRTLHCYANLGNGPPYRMLNGAAHYHIETALKWAADRYEKIGKRKKTPTAVHRASGE